jgi:ribosomal 50S subunit-recycling heat shock protein
MRLDVFLKLSRLVPRRTIAQEMCERGAVMVNGSRAKSAREVREGDQLSIERAGTVTTIRIVEVPGRPPSRAQARSLYETVGAESHSG